MKRPLWLFAPACIIMLGIFGCDSGSSPTGTAPSNPTETSSSGTGSSSPSDNAATSAPNSNPDPSTATGGDTAKPTENRLSFSDKTESSGVAFTYRNGEEAGHYSILESLGGGIGAIDFDLDGRDDLCLPGGGHFEGERNILAYPSALYRNLGNWKFADVSEQSGLQAARFYSHGATRTDFDNDGWPDVVITGYGGLELYHNMGDGTFEKLAPESTGLTDHQWSSTAAAADFNGDGNADLYVAHYVNWSFDNHPFCEAPEPGKREVCPPRSFDPLADTVYFSNGDGTFRDVSAECGIRTDGKGLSVVVADMDRDHDVDIYVTNDTVPNALYTNKSDGTFKDDSLLSGTSLSDKGVPDGSMGVDIFDFNNDADADIWVVNYERETSAVYKNFGKMVFRHVSQRTGINAVGGLYVGWGTCCYDYDLDSDEDMFVSNGHVIRYPTNAPLKQLPLLFENLNGDRFVNSGPAAGPYFRNAHMGRGATASDLDNDGDMDLVVSKTNDPVVLLCNDTPNDRAWLQVQLTGTVSSREPVGATIKVTSGKKSWSRFIKSGGSYASSFTPRVLFGLDTLKAPVTIEVTWPTGKTQTLTNITPNQLIHIVE